MFYIDVVASTEAEARAQIDEVPAEALELVHTEHPVEDEEDYVFLFRANADLPRALDDGEGNWLHDHYILPDVVNARLVTIY